MFILLSKDNTYQNINRIRFFIPEKPFSSVIVSIACFESNAKDLRFNPRSN
jgi:hypothetical protein